MKTRSGLSVIMLAAGLLAACGGSDTNAAREKAMEDAAAAHGINADVTVNDAGESEKIEINAGGGTVGRNLDLPAGFPDDINLPADWEVIAASSPMPGAHSVQILSDATRDEIMQTLRSRLTETGWSETSADIPAPSMARLGFEKGDRMANFNIIENGETRAVQVLTMPKP